MSGKRDIDSEIAGEIESIRKKLKVPNGKAIVNSDYVKDTDLIWSVLHSEWIRPLGGEIGLPVDRFYGVCRST